MAEDTGGMSLAMMLEQALADGKVSDEAVARMLSVLWAYRSAGVGTLVGTELRRAHGLRTAQTTLEQIDVVRNRNGGAHELVLAQEVIALREALDTIDTMNPDDCRLGQGHLTPPGAVVSVVLRERDRTVRFGFMRVSMANDRWGGVPYREISVLTLVGDLYEALQST